MAKHLQLIQTWLTLNRGEIRAILLGVALLSGLFVAAIWTHGFVASNAGFGPDWDCTDLPNSEPVCVKKPAPPFPGSS